MHGADLINSLAALLIVTSLFVILARTPAHTALFYSLQSFVLVCAFVAIAHFFNVTRLYHWAMTSVLTKVTLVPVILYYAFLRTDQKMLPSPVLGPAAMIALAAVVVVVSAVVVRRVQIPMAAGFTQVMMVCLSLIFLGLACIITQRSILKQISGLCLIENGSHLTLALLAHQAPELLEIGIGSDAIFAVIALTFFATQIRSKISTFDDRALMALKD
jgi:hydrogenase-4 component E